MFMDIFDQILENLELERELGTRTVEIDRALLVPPTVETAPKAEPAPKTAVPNPPAPVPQTETRKVQVPQTPHVPQSSPQAADSVPVAPKPSGPQCDIAFFTGRPLSPAGQEAMTKTFAAMRRIRPDTTIRLNEECSARVIVLLGSDALAKRLPATRPIRGAWVDVAGTPAIMTFSPDYIFTHFQDGSPNMNKAKLEMWNDIKLAVARL
jgi:hypothetical protein